MNATGTARQAVPFPYSVDTVQHIPDPPKMGAAAKMGIRTGVLMTRPDNPKGWGWSPAVVTLCLVILGMLSSIIAGAAVAGYYYGQYAAERKFLFDRLERVEAEAADASKKAVYAIKDSDQGDGHRTDPKEKK